MKNDSLQAYLLQLPEIPPEDVTIIDRMATAIESSIPHDTKNRDAIRARHFAQDARKFGMSEKGVLCIVEAQCSFKDYMLFDDAVSSEKSKNGYRTRDDYADKRVFIELAKTIPSPPTTLTGWKKLATIAPYARKYKGDHTLRDWINEALPGVLKNGRPKKT